jgi:hypothetical protein
MVLCPGVVHNCLALFLVKIRLMPVFFGAREDLDLLIGIFTILLLNYNKYNLMEICPFGLDFFAIILSKISVLFC